MYIALSVQQKPVVKTTSVEWETSFRPAAAALISAFSGGGTTALIVWGTDSLAPIKVSTAGTERMGVVQC